MDAELVGEGVKGTKYETSIKTMPLQRPPFHTHTPYPNPFNSVPSSVVSRASTTLLLTSLMPMLPHTLTSHNPTRLLHKLSNLAIPLLSLLARATIRIFLTAQTTTCVTLAASAALLGTTAAAHGVTTTPLAVSVIARGADAATTLGAPHAGVVNAAHAATAALLLAAALFRAIGLVAAAGVALTTGGVFVLTLCELEGFALVSDIGWLGVVAYYVLAVLAPSGPL